MTRIFTIILLLFSLAAGEPLWGQAIFPISATTQSIPPFDGTLSQFASPGKNKLVITLMLKDINEISYQARLKLSLSGSGIEIRTKESVFPPPITLSYGQPVQLSGALLDFYFNPDNLDFSGITRNEFLQQGGLPDGFYTLCVEVWDYDRSTEKAGSLSSCTNIPIIVNDPPVILSPLESVQAMPVQQMAVQWQAMHQGGFPTEYNVLIHEYDPRRGMSPDMIIRNEQPYIIKTVNGITTLNIDPSDPPLSLGQQYIIQVQARDFTQQNFFKNNGWSEPKIFTYGEACGFPSGIAVNSVSEGSATISWTPLTGYNKYILRYRDSELEGANWYEDEILLNQHTIEGLNENTSYEYQVITLCEGRFTGIPSPVATFTTLESEFDPDEYECGDTFTVPEITNQEPIANLTPGNVVSIGGFEAKITSAGAASGGGYNGTAQVKVGWMGKTINVMFKGLFVNTDREVYDGNMVAMTDEMKEIPGYVDPKTIDAQELTQLDPCGNARQAKEEVAYSVDDFYATHQQNTLNHFIPYNPNKSVDYDESLEYDPYNPYNGRQPYDPDDYSNSVNPYTKENPYDPLSIYNPYNRLNPYDPYDYSDPANPYSPTSPYDPKTMNTKEKLNTTTLNPVVTAGGVNLPIGLSAFGDGSQPMVIALVDMFFTPRGASLSARLSADIPTPEGPKYAFFKMAGVAFHPGGLGGEGKLRLEKDFSIPWNGKANIVFKSSPFTYVAWDCHGVNDVFLDGQVEFCRDLLLPVDQSTGKTLPEGYVTGAFQTQVTDWRQFVLDVTFSPFEVPQLKGWTWSVENAILDFHDGNTPADVVFPAGYSHPDVANAIGQGSPAWKGFYLKSARVTLPEELSGSAQNQSNSSPDAGSTPSQQEPPVRRTIGVNNLVIDQTGFTGYIYATNVFPLDDGRIDSWAFSLDSIGVGVVNNHFQKAAFKGQLAVPAFKQTLGYDALIQPGGKYALAVSIQETLEIDAWKAKVNLYKDSAIKIEYNEAEGRFVAGAKLNGQASFTAPTGSDGDQSAGKTLNIPSIGFQGFELSSKAPYIINIGTWQLSSGGNQQEKLAGFPLTINQVGALQNKAQTEVAIVFDLDVHLMKDAESGFSAGGRVGIISSVEMDEATNRQVWTFKRVRVERLSVEVSGPAYEFKGQVNFYENDSGYGTGFRGFVQATFTPKLSVAAVAQFGSIDNFRYWYVDALASFDPGIPLGASGLSLYGFGGGAYYHMRRTGPSRIILPAPRDNPLPTQVGTEPEDYMADGNWLFDESNADAQDNLANARPKMIEVSQQLGKSLSNVTYVPDESVLLGVKAMVALGTVKREVLNGSLTFEIVINSSGGLKSIGFQGDANFLTPPAKTGEPAPSAAVSAYLDMMFDFEHKSFHADLKVYVNLLDIVKGIHENNLAGHGIIHADPEEWYIYLGTPEKRIGLSFNIPGLSQAGTPKAPALEGGHDDDDAPALGISLSIIFTAYLDAGTRIPEFPDIPERVKEILGRGDFNIVSRDDPRFKNGGGLMFGASIDVVFKAEYLFFFASVYAGAGFDVMLKDYGEEARCAGNEAGGPIGINGWYATGQVYGYLDAKIGIQVNLFFIKARLPILQLGVAAVLQGRLPNPFWARGTVGGYFSVLNGLISGRCSFRFEMGQRCQIVGTDELAGIQIISSTSPDANNDEEVDVFIKPQVTFNLPVDEVFELMDEEGNTFYYRPGLKELQLKNLETQEIIRGEIQWGPNKELVAFRPEEVLPGQTKMELTVKVGFDKSTDEITWAELKKRDGTLNIQERVIPFTTGDAPNYIPLDNIAYSYPTHRQYHFMRSESANGYVQLKQGQDYLFNKPAAEWVNKLRYIQNGRVIRQMDFVYDPSLNRISFAVPSDQLELSAVAQVVLLAIPTTSDKAIDANVANVETELFTNQGEPQEEVDESMSFTEVLLKEQQILEQAQALNEESMLVLDFRTSRYSTFLEKMNGVTNIQHLFNPILLDQSQSLSTSIDDIVMYATHDEVFDKFELDGYFNGEGRVTPLIYLEADLTQTGRDWYQQKIFPYLYSHLPTENIQLSYRDPDVMGVIPVRAVDLFQNYGEEEKILEQGEILSGNASFTASNFGITYHVPYIMNQDDMDYKQQAIRYFYLAENMPEAILNFYENLFPRPEPGAYRVKMEYRLPGKAEANSVKTFTLQYGSSN